MKPLCFVIMPFTFAQSRSGAYPAMGKAELDTVFSILRRVLGRKGYEVRRSDSKGDILADIIYDLDRAELVIADLTSLNPNVMYELGIRHAFTKRAILLTQDLKELPFDLRAYHCIEYKWQTHEDQKNLSANLAATLKDILGNPDTKFGPVHSHLGTKRLALQEEEKRTTILKLQSLAGELYHLWNAIESNINDLIAEHPDVFHDEGDSFLVRGDQRSLSTQSKVWQAIRKGWSPTYPSVDLLIATRYIPHAFDEFSDITAFTSALGQFRLNMFALDDSLGSFLGVYTYLERLTADVMVVIDAIENDRYGQPLRLRSQIYIDDEIEQT